MSDDGSDSSIPLVSKHARRKNMNTTCNGEQQLPSGALASSSVRVDRILDWVFWVLSLVAVTLIMTLNRRQWFFADDFVFAFDRQLSDPVGLLRPHFGHNTVLPAIVFQLIYQVVGLHQFWPYQIAVALSHVAVACLQRALMLRMGTGRLLATAGATLFLFFGSGRENLTWAFQITLNGSLAFAFWALLVADRDRELDSISRRCDLLASLLLSGAALCSNLGPFLACVVGLAVFLRRGLSASIRVITPPLALFLTWRLWAPKGQEAVKAADIGQAVVWGREHLFVSFHSLTHVLVVSILLMMAVFGAIVMTVKNGRRPEDNIPLALLVGLVLLAASLGYTRGGFIFPASTPRYVYLGASLALPLSAWALGRLAESSKNLMALAVALLLVGLPANMRLIGPSTLYDELALGSPVMTAAVASVAVDEAVAGPYVIDGLFTANGLIRASKEGRIPVLAFSSEARREALLRVALGRAVRAPVNCRPMASAGMVSLRRGDYLDLGPVPVRLALADYPDGPFVQEYFPEDGGLRGLIVLVDRIDIIVEPYGDATSIHKCRG
ncbi:MAG: hypothetical protein H6519_06995 [Microthrixaceae bacterium]|nr:hypothetical protein [Acidimicrobiales bacterium]MCB9404169.1 hypothetical protein [Microthrixaceae bacterium]